MACVTLVSACALAKRGTGETQAGRGVLAYFTQNNEDVESGVASGSSRAEAQPGRAMRRLRPLKFLTGAPSTYVGARLGRPGRTLFKPELLFKGFVIVEGAGTARCYPEHKRRWHAGARARRRRCVAVRKRRRARFEPLPISVGAGSLF